MPRSGRRTGHSLDSPSLRRSGRRSRSCRWRCASLWSPLDFRALLQFLTHPVGPLPGFARRRLAEKMAATPGIGGEPWDRVLGEIADHYGADGAPVIADIRFWLETARFTSADQAPLEFVLERVDRLAKLFQKRCRG